MHQTGVVGAAQHLGAGGQGAADLVLAHGGGDVGVLDGEGAAEAAALLGTGQLPQLQALDRFEEPAWPLPQAQGPQPVAGGVVGDGVREAGADIGDTKDVDQELGEFVRTGRECALPELGIVLPHHRRARPRRRHDVFVALECLRRPPYQRLGLSPVAGVVLRLSATGLRRREVHLDPQPFQESDGRDARGRIHRVVDAGDEECDTHGRRICRHRQPR